PQDVCQLLQGGGELGAHLVRSAQVHLIAFTGSREVGLEILREAHTHRPGQNHVKRVVCEMGGKNALIIDADADLDEAVVHTNDSAFALTGGIFSRSPAHIEKAREEFRVGNLYINRGITGAIVERQPFGGLKLSGIGSKAGGPDYLLQFLEPRTVSENTLRHGFVAPEELKK